MNIHFEKANLSHIDIVFGWLAEPYVQEFWDKWQTNKQLYENVTAFDIAMLDETGLDRLQTIQGWRLKLEKGTRLTG